MQTEINDDVLRVEETRYLLRNPGFVALLSGLVMGLGQLFNGQTKKGMIFFFSEVGIFLYFYDYLGNRIVAETLISFVGMTAYHSFLLLMAMGGISLWVFNILDAYRVAQFLSFIYDRSIPQMVDEENEAFYSDPVSLAGQTIRLRRGFSRKSIFMFAAVLAYTGAILSLGSRFIARNEEMGLLAAVDANPLNAQAFIRLGDIYLGENKAPKARKCFEEVLRIARETGEGRLAYHAFTSLARVHVTLEEQDKANEMLREALALFKGEGEAVGDPSLAGSSLAAAPVAGTDEAVGAMALVTPASGKTPDFGSGSGGIGAIIEDSAPAAKVISGPDLLAQARRSLEKGDVNHAASLLEKARATEAETQDFHEISGRVHAAREEWEPAIRDIEAARSQGARSRDLDLSLSSAYLAVGRESDAIALLEELVARQPGDIDPVLIGADILLEKGDARRVRKLLAAPLEKKPDDSRLLTRSFSAALLEGSHEQAYDVAVTLVKSREVEAGTYERLVQEALERRAPSLAARIGSLLIEKRPTDPVSYQVKGEVLDKGGDRERAVEYYVKAVALGSQDVKLLRRVAEIHLSEGRTAEAREVLERVITQEPNHAPTLRKLAALHAEAGAHDKAAEQFAKVEQKAPETLTAEDWLAFARCLMALGQYPEAAGRVRRVIGANPANAEADRLLLEIERKAPAPRQAPEKLSLVAPGAGFEDVPGDDPTRPLIRGGTGVRKVTEGPALDTTVPPVDEEPSDSVEAMLTKAGQALAAGDNADAARLFERAAGKAPKNAKAHHGLARSLRAMNRDEEAVEAYDMARKRAPGNLEYLKEMSEYFTEVGRSDKAITALEGLLERDPKNIAARYALGVNYEKIKDYGRAEDHYRQIAYNNPEHVEAHDYLGNLYFTQGRYALASREYQKIVDANADDSRSRFKLAVSLINQGAKKRARSEFERLDKSLEAEDPLREKVGSYLEKLDKGD